MHKRGKHPKFQVFKVRDDEVLKRERAEEEWLELELLREEIEG